MGVGMRGWSGSVSVLPKSKQVRVAVRGLGEGGVGGSVEERACPGGL